MSGYSANPDAARAVAQEMTKAAHTLDTLNRDLTKAAQTSLSDWNATAKAMWQELQGKLTAASSALSNKGLVAGSSVNNTMDAIQDTDRKIAGLF